MVYNICVLHTSDRHTEKIQLQTGVFLKRPDVVTFEDPNITKVYYLSFLFNKGGNNVSLTKILYYNYIRSNARILIM